MHDRAGSGSGAGDTDRRGQRGERPVSYLRVKVCGITREEDALRAARHGADAIGFVLWPGSPRSISIERAAEIARVLPPFVWKVGVFVNASPQEIERAAGIARLDVAQLHGDEDVERYRSLAVRIIKAIGVAGREDVEDAIALPADVMPLVDAADRDQRGGTGRRAHWDLAAEIAKARPTILAGGLNAENIIDAVEIVHPWGVDLSSSLEDSPGVKNANKVAVFFAAVEPVRSVK
ncbi:MAG: phosphoribosylanthranilate isomerase [Acidobacteria bacterium]|nr:MAG: phosphoribosylanthranilate isomerase [Acidobacteriota bacterium]